MGSGGYIRNKTKSELRINVKGLRSIDRNVVPTYGDSGYAPSCTCFLSDGDNAGDVYINEGTYEACDFARVGTLSGATAGTATASTALIVDASKDLTGLNVLTVASVIATALSNVPVAATATATGATTGTIADGGTFQHVNVTASSAAHIVVLPTPVAGKIVVLAVGDNGYELASDTPASVGIGGGTGAAVSSAIPADSVAVLYCISATSWVGFTITAATLAAVEAAA